MENEKDVLAAPHPLSQLFIPPEVLQTLPSETALALCALPLARYNDILIVAVRDAKNEDAIRQLREIIGLAIFPLQADMGELKRVLEQHYDPTYPARKAEEEKYQQQLKALELDLCKSGGEVDLVEKLFHLIILDALRKHASLITWKVLANGGLDILYRIKGEDRVVMKPPVSVTGKLLRHVSEKASLPEDSEDEVLFGTITLKNGNENCPAIAIAVDQTMIVQKTCLEPLDAEQTERVHAVLRIMSFDSPADKLVCIILLEACICEADEILIEKSSFDHLLIFHLKDRKKRLVMEAPTTMFLPVLRNLMIRARQLSEPNFLQRFFRRKIVEPSLVKRVHGSFYFDDVTGNRHRIFYETRSFLNRTFLRLAVSNQQTDWSGFFDDEISSSPVHDRWDDR